jgi:putative phosphoesterase
VLRFLILLGALFMRIALFSDIHGNPIALDAVLADIEAQGGVDAYWVLGDLVAIGPDPVGVLERLTELPNASFVRGNTDRYVVTGARPKPTPDEVIADSSLLPVFAEVMQSFAWTQGAVTSTNWLTWLAALPLEQRLLLPNGTQLLGVHASPGCDDGDGIHPALSETELHALLIDCNADLVCVGHTHWPLELRLDGVHLINLGSVSNPTSPDLRASYLILDADASGYRVYQRRVEYDHEAVIAALQWVRHPAAGFITRFMRGWYQYDWEQQSEKL